MELSTSVNGSSGGDRDKANNIGQMVLSTKGTGETEQLMVKDACSMLMEMHTKEAGLMIEHQAKELTTMLTEQSTKVIGLTTNRYLIITKTAWHRLRDMA